MEFARGERGERGRRRARGMGRNARQAVAENSDARRTKKNAQAHYGDKNHAKAEVKSKLVERYPVTDVSLHDPRRLA